MKAVIYEDSKGNSDLKKHLDTQSQKEMKKFLYSILQLEEEGTRLGEPKVKHLVTVKHEKISLWELRIGKDRYPFFINKECIILLSYFRKSTQKTPKRELEKAIRFAIDWKERNC